MAWPTPKKTAAPEKAGSSTPLTNLVFSREAIYVQVNGKQERLRADEAAFHAFFVLGVYSADFYLRENRDLEAAVKRPGLFARIMGLGKKMGAVIPPPVIPDHPGIPPLTPVLPMHGGKVPALDRICVENENIVTKWADGKTLLAAVAKEESAYLLDNLQSAYMELRTLGIQNVVGVDGQRPKKFSSKSLTGHLPPAPPPGASAPLQAAAAASSSPQPGASPAPGKFVNDKLNVAGKLIEHKRDHFQFKPEENLNYYIKVHTGKGERIVWGVDLPRAIEDCGARVGDTISAQNMGKRPVKVKRPKKDADGAYIKDPKTGEVCMEEAVVERVSWDMQVLEKGINVGAQNPSSAGAAPEAQADQAAPSATKSPPAPVVHPDNVDAYAQQISEDGGNQPTPASAFEELPPRLDPNEDLTPHTPIDSPTSMSEPPTFLELGEEQPGAALDGPAIINVKHDGKVVGIKIDPATQAILRPKLLHGEITQVSFVPATHEEKRLQPRKLASVVLAGSKEPSPWPLPATPTEKTRFGPGTKPLHVTINKAPVAESPEPSM